MTEYGHLYIIGCGLADQPLSGEAAEILKKADVIAGGKRLLDCYAPPEKELVLIGAKAGETARKLVKRSRSSQIVILASGDPLYFGIGATVAKIAPPGSFTVLPHITAFQAAFARLGISWSNAELFSLHGKTETVPWRKFLSACKAAIYCDNRLPANKLATKLLEHFPQAASRRAAAFENLGRPDETFQLGTLKDIAAADFGSLSLLVLAPAGASYEMPGLPLGLDDAQYEHENNLITHPEVRAVILSKLRLGQGIMWDLGAGSGSVGIEAAGLCRALTVISVEKSPARIKHIKDNARLNGITRIRVFEGNILKKIPELPAPDFIFAGGGGRDILEIVENSFEALNSGGRLVVSAVTLETVAALSGILPKNRIEAVSLTVSRAKAVGDLSMMKADNPIYIFVFQKD
ncbi:precorrin-6y C5,15-methyltransferase (decarboxylating) subunit CbiE [Lentisphaerota bacterium ZTH]|nr:precorrin-6y C5,15-methyltransferase (decarboxylating) subunit CbiE [Lentisphaerota bacterium]WET07544.1 precorrin-6y C5,15-methyltransferase (decarboxylating) subunit CbiE [Lentisphaerota bacterium ZTH]